MQERRSSIANALELHLCCINPSICIYTGPLYLPYISNEKLSLYLCTMFQLLVIY